jgi:hypothetical protein
MEIVEKLLGEIPEGACVLVYSMGFEKRVLRELGIRVCPSSRHNKRSAAPASRLAFLVQFIRARRDSPRKLNISKDIRDGTRTTSVR